MNKTVFPQTLSDSLGFKCDLSLFAQLKRRVFDRRINQSLTIRAVHPSQSDQAGSQQWVEGTNGEKGSARCEGSGAMQSSA